MENEYKKCENCGSTKPKIEFWKRNGTKDNLRNYCKECEKKSAKAWRIENKDYFKKYNKDNRNKLNSYYKKYNNDIRLDVLIHYVPDLTCHGIDGKGCKFNCSDIKCLTIDHINGGGNEHRKKNNLKSSSQFYRWLYNNNYPLEFQVLCMNCQWLKR
jgi:hypothetical protein